MSILSFLQNVALYITMLHVAPSRTSDILSLGVNIVSPAQQYRYHLGRPKTHVSSSAAIMSWHRNYMTLGFAAKPVNGGIYCFRSLSIARNIVSLVDRRNLGAPVGDMYRSIEELLPLLRDGSQC